jgi:hypothetical protein
MIMLVSLRSAPLDLIDSAVCLQRDKSTVCIDPFGLR